MLAALFTLLYMVKLYTKAFLGQPAATEWQPVNGFLVALVVVMALVSLAGGVAVMYPVKFLQGEVVALIGVL